MNIHRIPEKHQNISQRAAASYLKSLSSFTFVLPMGANPQEAPEIEASQRDLHAFFTAFYESLYENPAQFGLPLGEDDYIGGDRKYTKEAFAQLTRKIKKPKDTIKAGLDFLAMLGLKGSLQGDNLLLSQEEAAPFVKMSRTGKKFIQGLASAGLTMTEAGDHFIFSSSRFPKMMPALKALSEQCARHHETGVGCYNFERCDFKALQQDDYTPDALELFSVFTEEEFKHISDLHRFFVERGYKPIYGIRGVSFWMVQYQGKKQIKATPLFQVEYHDRHLNPFRVQIKCASANRLTPFMPEQPKALQADFVARVNKCGDCTWCRNQKVLGPSEFEYEGQKLKVCWYVNPDVDPVKDETVELIKQYAYLHESLGV